MKIYRRPRVWIMLAFLLLLNLAMGLVCRNVESLNIQSMYTFMSISINIYPLILIFAIVIASDIVSSEFSWGTIKLLLTRPLKRWKVLVSKYLAMLLFALFFSLVLFGCSGLVGYILWENVEDLKEQLVISQMLLLYLLRFIDLIMYVTLTFMLSTVFLSSTLAIVVSMILFMTKSYIIIILDGINPNLAKYFVYAHSNLTHFFDGTETYNGGILGFSLTLIIFHFVLFNLISWYVFKKRDISV